MEDPTFKSGFLGQPSYIRDICVGNHCVVDGKYLLSSCFLIFDVDGSGRDAIDNDSVDPHLIEQVPLKAGSCFYTDTFDSAGTLNCSRAKIC